MNKINKDNYEAYFLDFVENNLSDEDFRLLEIFLSENPDLREELEGFELIELPMDASHENWDSMKKVGNVEDKSVKKLTADAGLRDMLYFSVIEKTASESELAILDTLRKDAEYDKEFKLWQSIILQAGEGMGDKATLYQFGLERDLSEFNYAYYLVARTEGLLTDLQNEKLESFALAKPQGKRDLEIADNLKLQPALGIFFPDKAGLRKKEKAAGIIWLYRAAAIAAIFLLGVFIWNTYQEADAPAVADVKKAIEKGAVVGIDSTENSKTEIGTDSIGNNRIQEEPNLQEWEVREPDVAEYAVNNKNAAGRKPTEKAEKQEEIAPQIPETETLGEPIEDREMEMAEINDATEIELPNNEKEDPKILGQEQKSRNQSEKFKTLPEFAEDALAKGLDIPDDERDAMALAVAKRITERAGELLDTDIKRESSGSEGSESLTYSLRIGNFKVSHSKPK